ncbi:MAG: flagellar basal body rod protein FlgC [Bdellovibrionota bacterium]|jgi:flagellar basal-body rod protein FlgC
MFNSMEVLSSGLSVNRLRVNLLASNIANAETTKTEDGTPYKPKQLVQVAQTMKGSFSSSLDKMSLAKPVAVAVVEDQGPSKMVYQPGHPDADENGYVAYPNINVVSAMTDLMTASRLYQANATALDTAKEMLRQAREIAIRM